MMRLAFDGPLKAEFLEQFYMEVTPEIGHMIERNSSLLTSTYSGHMW